MIFGHEGGVRAGKSYEAVLYHILPALKAKRDVYVRLNGVADCVDAIAARLEMDAAEVKALLHPMGNQEVRDWLVCDTANDGSMAFPHVQPGSLVVVDEAHEYWPTGRAALPERVAEFFAKHGHISLDVVLITQDVKELHRSVVRRMTKKNFYAKLDAVGRDNQYSVRFYTSPAPGRFELIGSEKREYDPEVWKCYYGVQPGIEGNEVYKGNTTTLWKAHRKAIIAMSVGCLLGVGLLARFFMGGMSTSEPKPVAKSQPVQEVYQRPVQPAPVAIPPVVYQKPPEPEDTAPAAARYVSDLAKSGRPRFAGSIGDLLIVEFRAAGAGTILDQLTSTQLAAMGWKLTRTAYGALATFEDREIVFTAWPVDMVGVQSIQTTERIRAAGAPVTSGSETQPRPAVAGRAGTSAATTTAQHAYGQFRETSNPGGYNGSTIYNPGG